MRIALRSAHTVPDCEHPDTHQHRIGIETNPEPHGAKHPCGRAKYTTVPRVTVGQPGGHEMSCLRSCWSESSNDYSDEICRHVSSAGEYRIIICRDGIQWILQHRAGAPGSPVSGRWKAVAYHTSRDGLKRRWQAATGTTSPEINGLPTQFKR